MEQVSTQHSQLLRKSNNKLSVTDRLDDANQLLVTVPKHAETICLAVSEDENLGEDILSKAADLLDQVDISKSLFVAADWLENEDIDDAKKAKNICLEALDKHPLDARLKVKATNLLVAAEKNITQHLLGQIQHSFQDERPSSYLETRKICLEILSNKNLKQDDQVSTNEKLDQATDRIKQTLNEHLQNGDWKFTAMEIMIFCNCVLGEQTLATDIHESAKQLLLQAEKRAMGEMVMSLASEQCPYNIENTYKQILANQPNDPGIVQMAAEIKLYLLKAKLNEAESNFLNGRHTPEWIKQFCQGILNDPDLHEEIEPKVKALLEKANSNVSYIQKIIKDAKGFQASEIKESRDKTTNTLIGLLKDRGNDLTDSDYIEINKLLVDFLVRNGKEKEAYYDENDCKKFRCKYIGLDHLIQQLKDVGNGDVHQKLKAANVQLAQSTSSDKQILHLAIASEMGCVESSFQLAKKYKANEKIMPIMDHIKKDTTVAQYYTDKTKKQAIDQENFDIELALGIWVADSKTS